MEGETLVKRLSTALDKLPPELTQQVQVEFVSQLLIAPYEWRERRVESISAIDAHHYSDLVSLQFRIQPQHLARALVEVDLRSEGVLAKSLWEQQVARGRGGQREVPGPGKAVSDPGVFDALGNPDEWSGEKVYVPVPVARFRKEVLVEARFLASDGSELPVLTRYEDSLFTAYQFIKSTLESEENLAVVNPVTVQWIVWALAAYMPQSIGIGPRGKMQVDDDVIHVAEERLRLLLATQPVRGLDNLPSPELLFRDYLRARSQHRSDPDFDIEAEPGEFMSQWNSLGNFMEQLPKDALEDAHERLRDIASFWTAIVPMEVELGRSHLIQVSQRLPLKTFPVNGFFPLTTRLLGHLPTLLPARSVHQTYVVTLDDARSTRIQVSSPDSPTVRIVGGSTRVEIGRNRWQNRRLGRRRRLGEVFDALTAESTSVLVLYSSNDAADMKELFHRTPPWRRRLRDWLLRPPKAQGTPAPQIRVAYKLDSWLALGYLIVAAFAVAAVWSLWRSDGGFWPTWRVFLHSLQTADDTAGISSTLGPLASAIIGGLAGLLVALATLRERAMAARCLMRIRLVLMLSLFFILLRFFGAFAGTYVS